MRRITGKEEIEKGRKKEGRSKEGRNVLFNDAMSTFYLRLNGVGHMEIDHRTSERGNPL